MKKIMLLALTSALCILLVPIITYAVVFGSFSSDDVLHPPYETYDSTGDTISVYIADEEKTEIMDFREYIIGVVAAEMPVEFESEALSAGACAAATLARLNQQKGSNDELDGAVISTDSTKHQAYMTKEEMKERWNGDFESYYEKLCDAVDKAIAYSITYEGELIVPAYHAISSGKTENAENVWTGGFPYLVSVESTGDTLSPKYASEITLSFDEFREKMEKEGAVLGEDITVWFSKGEYTEAGTLMNIKIGDKDFSGEQLREIFSLRSAAVTFSMTSKGVTMNVKGYGHGVGMSQYGADYLARQGYTWEEILKHYYTGVEIEII